MAREAKKTVINKASNDGVLFLGCEGLRKKKKDEMKWNIGDSNGTTSRKSDAKEAPRQNEFSFSG
jgi:hypothetical protein